MVWLINPTLDFDAEKRRRWYAASIGVAGATTIISVLLIQLQIQGVFKGSSDPDPDPLWQVAIVIFGFWVFFFVLKYAAAYAFWYRPYASRKRAISLSLCATLAVYLILTGGGVLFSTYNGSPFDLTRAIMSFWDLHKFVFGMPYIAAALVGWRFARPPPDARESF